MSARSKAASKTKRKAAPKRAATPVKRAKRGAGWRPTVAPGVSEYKRGGDERLEELRPKFEAALRDSRILWDLFTELKNRNAALVKEAKRTSDEQDAVLVELYVTLEDEKLAEILQVIGRQGMGLASIGEADRRFRAVL